MRKTIVYLLVLVMVLSSVYSVSAAETALKDISKHWAKGNIEYLYNLKYVSGYPDGTYRPDNPVSMVEFIKLVTLAAGYKLENNPKLWYENYLNKALEMGIVADKEYPDISTPLTREQVAKISSLTVLHKEEAPLQENDEIIAANIKDITKVSNDKRQYVINAYNLGLMEGGNGALFNPQGTLTRAEMCTIIMRIMDKTKRKPFSPENGHAIILTNMYSGDRYIISRPEKKEEIQLAYKLLNAKGKNKGWYCVSYAADGDMISSPFYESNQTFIEDEMQMQAALNIFLDRYSILVPTYTLTIYQAKGVKELQRESICEVVRYLFPRDYEKVMAIIDKNLEDSINGTAVKTDANYKFDNRKLNIYRPSNGSQFAVNIYKVQ